MKRRITQNKIISNWKIKIKKMKIFNWKNKEKVVL